MNLNDDPSPSSERYVRVVRVHYAVLDPDLISHLEFARGGSSSFLAFHHDLRLPSTRSYGIICSKPGGDKMPEPFPEMWPPDDPLLLQRTTHELEQCLRWLVVKEPKIGIIVPCFFGQGHGFGGAYGKKAWDATWEFFDRHLKP
jgi:hypothetical protein